MFLKSVSLIRLAIKKHAFNAYGLSFRGGVYVAMGDTNGNGLEEIVTSPASGGGPHIRAFNGRGMIQSQFFAYDTSVRSGYLLAVGDVNGDGRAEIGTLDVSRGRTIIFANRSGGLVGEVEIEGFGTGFTFTVGDMDRDLQHDLILGVQPNTSPLVRFYTITGKFISQITVGDVLPTGPIWVSPIDWIPL